MRPTSRKEVIHMKKIHENEEIVFVKWITRKGKKIYPPKGLKAWPLRVHKKKVS